MSETITHGRTAFVKHKCRCEICGEASRSYKRAYSLRKGKTIRRLDSAPFIERLQKDGRLAAVQSTDLWKWRTSGIDLWAADRWAIRLGYHPLEIWGQDFYVGVSEMDNNYE
jgi:hypothetical protein